MNLYVRYFAHETFVNTADEAVSFLEAIPEIKVDQNMVSRIKTFADGPSIYPYHLKVSFNNYVIIIKSEANSMEEFKELQQQKEMQKGEPIPVLSQNQERKKTIQEILNEPRPGWYEASLNFKRVVLIPETSKFQYKDTLFRVKCKAQSPIDCYNRIVDHLRNRQDVDPRSQFPSSKSTNFQFKYLEEENNVKAEEPVTNAPADDNVPEAQA
jgi:Ulp1 family protease